MKIKKNTRLIVLMTAIIMAVCMQASAAFAEETQQGSYDLLIMDEANLLTDAEEARLAKDMEPLLEYGNVIFSSVELDSWDFESHAEDTYYENYGREPGVIFQIDMGNRKLTLSASTGMETMIGHERESIVDNIYTLATDGDYYGCARECYVEIYNVINGIKIAHKMKYIDNAICALILALILNFIIVFVTTRNKVNKKRLLGEIAASAVITDLLIEEGKVTKRKAPKSSGGGGHSSGGGFSGGGGGGGFSGGSSSHGF